MLRLGRPRLMRGNMVPVTLPNRRLRQAGVLYL